MKLNKFLTSLSRKTGLDLTKPEFKDILASEIEVPDEMTNALEAGLMSEDAAKSNTKIRSAIKAEVYNGVDSEVNGLIDGFGLEEAIKTEILSEKKSIDKIKKLASTLKEQSEKAAKNDDKTQSLALKKQVEELNNQIKIIKTDSQKKIDQLIADNENSLNDFSFKSVLGTKNYALPDKMTQEEKVNMIHSILTSEIKGKGYKLVRNSNGSITLLKEDGTEPYDDKNNKLTLSTFADGALAQRGLLKVSGPRQDQQGNGGAPNNVTGGGNGNVPQSSQQTVSQLDKEIADMLEA